MTGASGFLGTACQKALIKQGHQIIPLVRRHPRPGEAGWASDAGTVETEKLAGIDAAIHLAGESISGRWNSEKKRRILDSRRNGTRTFANALAGLVPKPRVLISISGINYYGDRGDEILTEESAIGDSFLAEVCREWEAATAPASNAGIRVVTPRLGVVISREGGALPKMMTPFKFGLGGRLGSGKQWMSWIALDDAVAVILHSLKTESLQGAVNATSPNPIRNADFSSTLAKALHRPAIFAVPAFALRLFAGQMAEELLLTSTRALPEKLLESGFKFKHDKLEDALRQ